jgi:hypothetical protein
MNIEQIEEFIDLAKDVEKKVERLSELLKEIDSNLYDSWDTYGKHISVQFDPKIDLYDIVKILKDRIEASNQSVINILKESGFDHIKVKDRKIYVSITDEDFPDIIHCLTKHGIYDDNIIVGRLFII